MIKIFFTSLIILVSANSFADTSWQELWWAMGHQELIKNNARYIKRLASRFENKQIIGLELIVAAKSSRQMESRFGHAMLRFVDNTPGAGDDLTLSFVADVTTPEISYTGGLLGKYPVYPLIKPLRLFNRQYVKGENRPLERHIIPSNEVMREKMWHTLTAWLAELDGNFEEIYQKNLERTTRKVRREAKKVIGRDHTLVELKSEAGLVEFVGALKELPSPLEKHLIEKALFNEAKERAMQALKEKWSNHLVTSFGPSALVLKLDDSMETFKREEDINRQIQQIHRMAVQKYGANRFLILSLFPQKDLLLIPYSNKLPLEEQHSILANTLIVPLTMPVGPNAPTSDSMGRYTFLNNNCSRALVAFLKASGLPHKRAPLFAGRIPIKLSLYLEKSLLNPWPALIIDKRFKFKEKLGQLFSVESQKVEESLYEPNNWSTLINETTLDEKWLLLDSFELNEKLESMLEEIVEEQPGPDYDQLYGITSPSPILYSICRDDNCFREYKSQLEKLWGEKALQKQKKMKKYLKRKYKGLYLVPELRRHYEELF